jgi:hypothetical protein
VRSYRLVARFQRSAQQPRRNRRGLSALAMRRYWRAKVRARVGRSERERAPPCQSCVAQQCSCGAQFAPRFRQARARAMAQRRVGNALPER